MEKKISFYRPEEVNVKEFETIIDNMREDLSRLCRGEMDPSSVKEYVEGLVEEAKANTHRSNMMFWDLDDPGHMPSDARVEYVYMPTYIATAFMIKSVMLFPDLLNDKRIKRTMAAALRGSTARNFAGHGYENDFGRVMVLKIFTSVGTKQFIELYPELCPKFNELYVNTVNYIRSLVESGNAGNLWGLDFSAEVEEVLKIEMAS